MLCRKRGTASCLKANKNWEDMEEEGRAGWSREHSAERGQSVVTPLRWQRALGVTCLPWWGGGGTLCALKTVQDVYWEQGKLFRLGWLRSQSPCTQKSYVLALRAASLCLVLKAESPTAIQLCSMRPLMLIRRAVPKPVSKVGLR